MPVRQRRGFTEILDYKWLEIKNETKVIQVYYGVDGRSLELKPGQSGKILTAKRLRVSHEELAKLEKEQTGKRPGRPRLGKTDAQLGGDNPDGSGSAGSGKPKA